MRRFFYDHTQINEATPLANIGIDNTLKLTDTVMHHWCKVLRAKVGDTAILFDGLGGEYKAKLTHIEKKAAEVILTNYSQNNNAARIYSTIGLVMSRGDRMDYAIQKATEMGVSSIQLLTSHHGEVRLKPAQVDKKLNHWQQVAIAACEQCGLNIPPLIYAPLPINQWLDNDNTNGNVCDNIVPLKQSENYQALQGDSNIKLVLSIPKNKEQTTPTQLVELIDTFKNTEQKPLIKLLIGAEGGLSNEELEQAKNNDWQPWQIGNRILRTETAPIVALATLQAWSL